MISLADVPACVRVGREFGATGFAAAGRSVDSNGINGQGAVRQLSEQVPEGTYGCVGGELGEQSEPVFARGQNIWIGRSNEAICLFAGQAFVGRQG